MTSLSLPNPRLREAIVPVSVGALGASSAAVLVWGALRIAMGAAANPRYLVPSGRRTGFPAWMRGPFAGHAGPLPLHTFVVLMGVMVAAWLVVLVCAARLPTWLVWSGVGAATTALALAPPLLSTDVFNYIAYGQMGVRGINPYSHGPQVLSGTALYGFTGHLWKAVPSAYGPLFTLLTYALAPLGVATAFWTLKAIGAASLLALAAFTAASARRIGVNARTTAAFVALNPLVLVFALGGAHNDLLMAAVVAAAMYLAVSGRSAGAGAIAMAAVAIKLTAGLALPFVLLGAPSRRRAIAGAAGAGVALGLASLLLFGTAIGHMTTALAVQGRFRWIVVSVPAFIGHYAGIGAPGAGARRWIQAVAALAVVALIAAVARSRGQRLWLEAAAAAGLVVLFTAAWVLPWYIVLALPFAALARIRAVPIAAAVLTVVLMAMQLTHYLVTDASHHRRDRAGHHRRVSRRLGS